MSDFLHLFVHGIPQIDCWTEDPPSRPAPSRPSYPAHQRPTRPLPERPWIWHDKLAELSEAERALLDDARYGGAFDALHITEHWAPGMDPDCIEGWLLLAELLPELRARPSWWDGEAYTDETVDGLLASLRRVEARYQQRHDAYIEALRVIQTAPETDPAWLAYDEAVASLPARQAAHVAARTAYAQQVTGFETREAAEAAYWAQHTYTGGHAAMGYRPPAHLVQALHDAIYIYGPRAVRGGDLAGAHHA